MSHNKGYQKISQPSKMVCYWAEDKSPPSFQGASEELSHSAPALVSFDKTQATQTSCLIHWYRKTVVFVWQQAGGRGG